ncbi:MAG TPA: glutamate cyclase domain-containing protein [Chloroflexota bacterium]
MAVSVEDIVLQRDRRGVGALREHLPPDFCHRAAAFALERPGSVLIATGFCTAGVGETDGPLGAVALGDALEQLGFPVAYLTDCYATRLVDAIRSPSTHLVDVPILDLEATHRLAARVLGDLQPALLVSVERCGLTREGRYRTMSGRDITAETAYIDAFFLQHDRTIAVGDGGNEIGMGNLYDVVRATPALVADPAATPASHLVIASVSNWGAYGVVAALSLLVGRDLLPRPEDERDRLRALVAAGAVDGITGRCEETVDTFPWEVHEAVLRQLHALVQSGLGSQTMRRGVRPTVP